MPNTEHRHSQILLNIPFCHCSIVAARQQMTVAGKDCIGNSVCVPTDDVSCLPSFHVDKIAISKLVSEEQNLIVAGKGKGCENRMLESKGLLFRPYAHSISVCPTDCPRWWVAAGDHFRWQSSGRCWRPAARPSHPVPCCSNDPSPRRNNSWPVRTSHTRVPLSLAAVKRRIRLPPKKIMPVVDNPACPSSSQLRSRFVWILHVPNCDDAVFPKP